MWNGIAAGITAIAYRFSTLLQHLSRCEPPVLPRLRSLHAHIITSGFRPRSHVLNRLMDLYSKSGDLASARRLFDTEHDHDVVGRTSLVNAFCNAGDLKTARHVFDATPMTVRDTVCYNAMISGYARADEGVTALQIFQGMVRDSFCPDDYTMTSVLSAAGSLTALDIRLCWHLHCAVVKYGTEAVVTVGNALIALYSQCDTPAAILYARRVFNNMSAKDELTWTTMIVAYTRSDDVGGARLLFDGMTKRLDVTWNAMISGYVQHGLYSDALGMFRDMLVKAVPVDMFTYTSVLSACANLGFLRLGKSVHAHFTRTGSRYDAEAALAVDNALVTLYMKCSKADEALKMFSRIYKKDIVSWNAMLTGYVNLGCVREAQKIFESIPSKSLLTWTIMIKGYAQNGFEEDGIKLFSQMRVEGLEPCDFVFSGTIAACAGIGALELGRQIHALLVQSGHDSSNSAGNSLLTMYAKCGMVNDAHLVFLVMPSLDSISWNAMISALAQHGHGHDAIQLFEEMLHEGILPDRITFLTILSACNHAGLIDEGMQYFESMEQNYSINPGEEHYAKLIDLYGRAGRICKAKSVIAMMPFPPGPLVWEAVLSGCRISGDMELGAHAAEQLFEMTPQRDAPYVLLSNIYASHGLWQEVASVKKLMKDRQVKKEPGCSWIEVASKVHVFVVNGTDHPDGAEIYLFLKILGAKMRKIGYAPDTKLVLHDMDPKEKEHVLFAHSEKLAVAFGLLKLPVGATVRVLKNLRFCGDCHTAIMFMSMITEREIIVRDGKRYHHFKEGHCSCDNYW